VSRKLHDKQQRRLAEERRRKEQQRHARRRNLVTLGIVALVAVVVVALIVNERRAESGPVGVTKGEAGCTDIERFEEEGAQHVADGTDVQYETNPPTSGNHYGAPAEPGFYDVASGAQLPEERLVHNLEHGQIVFWYDPNNEEVQDDLERLIDNQPTEYALTLLAAPNSSVQAPTGFTMTAWGAMQSCEGVSEDVINQFRTEFQGRGPETFAEIPPFTGEGDA
jgi:Protein of unknown function (DUF3105)